MNIEYRLNQLINQSELSVSKPTLLSSSLILSVKLSQLLTTKFLVIRFLCYPLNTNLILFSSGSENTLNKFISLKAEWTKYPSFVFSRIQKYPSSKNTSRLTYPTIVYHIDFIPELFCSSNPLTSYVRRVPSLIVEPS